MTLQANTANIGNLIQEKMSLRDMKLRFLFCLTLSFWGGSIPTMIVLFHPLIFLFSFVFWVLICLSSLIDSENNFIDSIKGVLEVEKSDIYFFLGLVLMYVLMGFLLILFPDLIYYLDPFFGTTSSLNGKPMEWNLDISKSMFNFLSCFWFSFFLCSTIGLSAIVYRFNFETLTFSPLLEPACEGVKSFFPIIKNDTRKLLMEVASFARKIDSDQIFRTLNCDLERIENKLYVEEPYTFDLSQDEFNYRVRVIGHYIDRSKIKKDLDIIIPSLESLAKRKNLTISEE